MADIIPKQVSVNVSAMIQAGEKIAILVLNADDTTKTTLKKETVPTGKEINMSVTYTGLLEDAA